MKISKETIISKINTDFTSIYKTQSNFPCSGILYDECINTVNDVKLMNNIIFCNDVMKIPPVKTFLMSNSNINPPFSDEDKKSLGAFWGFIFKFVFDYTEQKDRVPINTKDVKEAAYFYEAPQLVEVID